MNQIPLTKGKFAIVDESDFDWLNQWKWCSYPDRCHDQFYAGRTLPGKKWISMHRYILGLKAGDPRQADHKNGNGLDNRRSNLRIATQQQNTFNRTRLNPRNTSGVTGVCFYPRLHRWRAQIKINGRQIYLGSFAVKEQAIKARKAGEKQHFGEFSPQQVTLDDLRTRFLGR